MKVTSGCSASLVAVLVLGGCATKPYEGEPNSASELTIALAAHYSGLVDGAFLKKDTPADASGQFRSVTRYWCAPSAKQSTVPEARSNFASLCSRLTGVWQEPYCQGPSDRERVLFMAQIVATASSCVNGTAARVFEPTNDPMAPAYVAALRGVGFRTNEDLARERAAAAVKEREAMARASVEADRRAALLPSMRQRGTRVCRAEAGNTYVGFVEGSSDTKLQIRVVNAFNTRVPQYQVGGFQPHIIWDVPSRWELCD